ncbi:TOBE domain-containing protein [Candidatus Halobonum tyrrellensis]|uniref:ModE family transcriptional regulator n=1 Tax=Candidatus Halobonum tyrrellensis G22 TaxID=1324957 RepID=V4GY46_9EURY|nr:TOBE domain-containing protein [Candidatus Halobonum tyrrellensis]ESP90106.1 ModE family transcriptional regulator [Candidatus Halobonum tyrrellensis G22]
MDLDAGFDARLERDGVRFGARDAELLRAVDEHGSLNAAAEALGRSYSRSQRRVVELEEAFGRLVDRTRGGADGGGSSLTAAADRLLGEFARLEAEFAGVTQVEETVLRGTVVDTEGELGTVETDAGPVRAVVPPTASAVRLAVRADAITLHPAGGVPETETSARNRFRGEVREVVAGDAVARVVLDVGADPDLTVLVTRTSVETLDLAPGAPVAASFKATATRAYPVESPSDE